MNIKIFYFPSLYEVLWVNYQHYILLVSCICFVCFGFCLLFSKRESVNQCLWGKQHFDAFHTFRNLETICCTFEHFARKHQQEGFRMFGSQSKDRLIFIQKTKHAGHVIVFGVFTSHGDVKSPLILPPSLRLNTRTYIKGPEIRKCWFSIFTELPMVR